MGIDTLASRINSVIILVLVLLWFTELFAPYGWHQKVSLLYEIDVGLLGVEINHGVALKAMDLAIRGLTPGAADALADVVVGKYSVAEASEYLCAVSQNFAPGVNGCEIWSQVNSASRIMQCMIITGIILLLLGGAFHYHYWFVSPRKKTRMWTRGFLIGAPAIIMTGFLIYFAMTKNLSNFPPRGTLTFGYCYVFGLWLCIWTCVPIFVHEQFAMQSSSEVMIEETKKAQKHFQNYGAAQQHAGYAPQQQYAPQAGYQSHPQHVPHAGGSIPATPPWATEVGYGYGGPMAFGGATPQGGASPRAYAAMQAQQGGASPGSYGAAPHTYGALSDVPTSGALRTSSMGQAQVPVSSSGTLRTSAVGQAQVPIHSSGALRTSSTSQAQVTVSSSIMGGAVGADAHLADLAAQQDSGSQSIGATGASERAAAAPGGDETKPSSNFSNGGSDSTGSSEAGGEEAAAPVEAVAATEMAATPVSGVALATSTVDGQVVAASIETAGEV